MKQSLLSSEQIAELFDHCGRHYLTETRLPEICADGILERLTFINRHPRYIIDLGCGGGQLTSRLAHRYPEANLIGIDRSQQMLRQASSYCTQLIQADATQIPLSDHSVDLVVANLSFNWSPLSSLLTACFRVLAANGLLFFTTLGPDSLRTLRRDYSQTQFIDMHDIGDQLVNLGFTQPVMERQSCTFRYRHSDTFTQEFHALGLSPLITLDPTYHTHTDIIANFEILYGHCFTQTTAKADEQGTVEIPLSHLRRRPT